ncbi:uncharacterized protein [Engystomops pustulosus]|uniref:uncharacterized protein n=1 Tax=Engystomops pustulosus TaxID=76066 RepID=UPI003AFA22AE
MLGAAGAEGGRCSQSQAAGRMETQTLGKRRHPMSSIHYNPKLQGMRILGLLCRESLLLVLAAAASSVSPDQDHIKFSYNPIDWSNDTDVHPHPVKCLVQQSRTFPNETFGDYQFTISLGDGIFIFGFICILIVLKSLLTKITMVENKPEDTEYVMTMYETPTTYKISLKKCTNNNNYSLTPPNSPRMSTVVTSTPVFYSGTRCCPLSNHEDGGHYYGERSVFSSPEGSTKSLV